VESVHESAPVAGAPIETRIVNILGIWDGHDSGAALLVDGRLVAAVNEERFSRRKLEVGFPSDSIAACLAMVSLRPSQVDAVAVSTADPAKALARCVPWTQEQYYQVRRRKTAPGATSALTRRAKQALTQFGPNPMSTAISRWVVGRALHRRGIRTARLSFADHHLCHAFCAAYGSGLTSVVVLTIDGLGDGLSATTSLFRDGRLTLLRQSPAAHSLGVFFEHVTMLLNMRELEDEGKVMALSEYASPVADTDNPLLSLVTVEEGRIRCAVTGSALERRLRRIHWGCPNEQFAYMAQKTVERVCVDLARDAVASAGEGRLALAGGVVSNVKATRLVRHAPGVKSVHVFPHMGDGGLALGAAIACAQSCGEGLALDFSRLDLGPSFDEHEIERAIAAKGLRRSRSDVIADEAANLIASGAIVLWFQGRMEYGPRALGNRSVLARPDRSALRDRLNLALKRRVWYQPFCPSMLESEARRSLEDWDGPSNPHMTTSYVVRDECRDRMAGVIALDGSCRPHIVPDAATDPFARLLHRLRARLGVGIVLNTSFNIHGEPLVCTPEQAVDVYLRSGGDALAIGPYLLVKDADDR
jgi:carbamoyltransferase